MPPWRDLRRALVCWAALAACVALMKVAGFVIAFGLLTWFIVAIMFRRPQRVALSIALGGALSFHALFAWVLDVRLPAGLFF